MMRLVFKLTLFRLVQDIIGLFKQVELSQDSVLVIN